MFGLTATLVGMSNGVAEVDGEEGGEGRRKFILVEPTENYRLKELF